MFAFIKKLLTRSGFPLPPAENETPPTAREDAPKIFARLFSTEDGSRVLAYLRALINTRVAGPEASEAALRYQDGQRGVLQLIAGLIDQGK